GGLGCPPRRRFRPPPPVRRPAAPRSPEGPEMAQASSILFVLGAIVVALGFAAHVGHRVLLANGRRVLAFAPARQPAFATGGVTGSFVTEHTSAANAPLELS